MDAKVFQLLNDLIEQRLNPQQAADLTTLLRTDPEVKEKYLRSLGVHQDLIEIEAPVRPFSMEELRAIKAVEEHFGNGLDADAIDKLAAEALAEQSTVGAIRATRIRERSHWGLWSFMLATAATVLIAVGLISKWGAEGDQFAFNEMAMPPESPEEADVVARIIKKIDCDWQEDRWSVVPSASITAGQQINLSRGLLVLKFNSGAELTLDGRATLVATSGKSAKLLEGKLSARVPPRGRGFKVETHAGDFVDLGTEFGMIVSLDGGVETHVFKGKVVAEPTSVGTESPESVVLETGAAWARPSSGAPDEKLNAEPERFVLPIIPDEAEHIDPPPAGRNLVLWFQANSRVQLDHHGNVSAWGDIAKTVDSISEDAWQVNATKRPEWVANAIGGQPALRFDGHKSLVTEPIHIGSIQTSAVVFRVDNELARRTIFERNEFRYLGVQLLNLNGPPHTVLQVNADARLEARVHLGFLREQADPVDVGFVCGDVPLSDGAHVAVYSYDARNSVARLYADGNLIAESINVPYVTTTNSPRYLGSHFEREGFGFTGDIAEILVFDSALSTEETQDVSHWLAEKYGIATSNTQQPSESSN